MEPDPVAECPDGGTAPVWATPANGYNQASYGAYITLVANAGSIAEDAFGDGSSTDNTCARISCSFRNRR